ncbi:cell division protein PerM [Enemella dayhoffiae]|nr:DUF6350 family protein [Enemella dayhoffiae]
MPDLMTSRRRAPRLTLRVRSADELDDGEAGEDEASGPQLPWYASAALAGLVAAAGGWLLLAGLVMLIWLTARSGAVLDAIGAGTQVWLLANGGGLQLGGQRWTLVPLTLTLLLALMIGQGAALAARAGLRADRAAGVEHQPADLARIVRNVTLLTSVCYAGAVTVTASLVGSTEQGVRALVGSAVLAVLAAYVGAARAVKHRLKDVLPGWARAVPAAVGAAVTILLLTGVVVLVLGFVQNHEQVQALNERLGLEGVNLGVSIVAQALFLPNLVFWCGAWALGAGFRFGQGSVISPSSTDLGLLPSIPVLGALPDEGPGSAAMLTWLAAGALAGAVAAILVMRGRPRARFDETAVVGGLSGILAALVFTALAATSGGDLGTERLTGIGPRLTELAVLSGALLGISGLAVGLIWGLVRRPLSAQAEEETYAEDEAYEVQDAEATTDLSEVTEADEEHERTTELRRPRDPEDEPTEVVERPQRRWNPLSRR